MDGSKPGPYPEDGDETGHQDPGLPSTWERGCYTSPQAQRPCGPIHMYIYIHIYLFIYVNRYMCVCLYVSVSFYLCVYRVSFT